ncbi:hypothetical protein [Acinetobacter ursingii]|uniref:hypothetical protein n=1 Tax=Acinetobacter ursingii TaxID=108980 RepID=UPI003AF681D0
MTTFLIFFIVVFIVALLILWMMLDYQFIRLINEMKAFHEKEIEIQLRPKSQLTLNQHIRKRAK